MATRFEIVHAHDDTFSFQLRTADGEVILSGLESPSKIMTQNEVLHLRNCLRDDSRMVPHEDDAGMRFVVVKDRDGTVLARSPKVHSEDDLVQLEQRMIAAASAPMVDLARKPRPHAG